MSATGYGWLVLAFPLAGCLVCAFGYRRLPGRLPGWIATGAIGLSFACSVRILIALLDKPESQRALTSTLYHYAQGAGLDIKLGILVDPLSIFMCLIVSGVSTLIHLYSVAYLDSDRGYARYFSYLNFFVFSMLLLVLAGNFVLLIVGWAFVGFASYALISFWYRRNTATKAGMKAFVINVIGDVGLVLATFFVFRDLGSFDFLPVFRSAEHTFHTSQGVVIAICLLMLVAAFAKSAQLPLHTWLPDAMEGPTPVSALIHAATMVTAGVYLIARTSPIFHLASSVQDTAAVLGAVTIVLAGLIALVQVDIKRVIAYSTMSQIGYMFLGVGIGAYASGMFHLMTHAFFKALLFLAAGVVIHALAGEQDIRRMGGLRKLMPWTYAFFLVGALSLAGIPPFSGFFSKDPIIAATLERGGAFGYVLFALALVGTLLTGIYTFRMVFRVFHGKPDRFVDETFDPHHGEGPLVMLVPVAILAVGATFAGWLQVPGGWADISKWLAPVVPPLLETTNTQEAIASILSVGLGLVGIGIAWWIYLARRRPAPAPAEALEKKFWFDELYDAVFYRPAVASAKTLYALVEGPLVGGSMTGIAEAVRGLGSETRRLQTGLVRTYVLALAASLAVLAIVFLAVR